MRSRAGRSDPPQRASPGRGPQGRRAEPRHASAGKNGGPSARQVRSPSQPLRPPSSFPSLDRCRPRAWHRTAGEGVGAAARTWPPSAQPGPRACRAGPRDAAVGGTSPRTRGQVSQEGFLGGSGEGKRGCQRPGTQPLGGFLTWKERHLRPGPGPA